MFDKLVQVQVLVLGATYAKIADSTCSATTIRDRRDDWMAADVFERLEQQICLEAYDRIVGLELHHVTVDGCIVKAPCGGDAAGKSPVDRGKQGTKTVAAQRRRRHLAGLRGRASELARLGIPAPDHGEARPVETRFGVGLPPTSQCT